MKKSKDKKIKKVLPVGRQGFTLIEVIVAVFIFALMASAASGVFVKMIKSYRYAKVVQKDLESAQYAMNLMAKTLRTSSVVGSGSSSKITVYDYSQSKCIEYEFNGITEEVYFRENTSVVSGISDCAGATYSVDSAIAENVDGRFDYSSTSSGVAMGKATISMTVSSGSNDTNIQSSVSLRDYSEAGI